MRGPKSAATSRSLGNRGYRATDAGSFTVFRRALPTVVGRLPCNALSRIVAPRADRRAPRASRLWTRARRRSSSAARPLARQPALIDDCHASSRRSFITICDFSRTDAISDSRYSFHSDFTQSSTTLVLLARRRTLAQSVRDTSYSYGRIYMRELCRMDNSITIL